MLPGRGLNSLGRFDASDVARRYVEWTEAAFDIGSQTRAAPEGPLRDMYHPRVLFALIE